MRDEMRIASLKEKTWYEFKDEDEDETEDKDVNKDKDEEAVEQRWEPAHYQ